MAFAIEQHHSKLEVYFDGNSIYCHEYWCYESRGRMSSYLINEAFSNLNNDEKNRMNVGSVFLFMGDYLDYPLSFSGPSYNDFMIPDYIFAGWPETGIHDYDDMCKRIRLKSIENYIDDRLFWIGNINTHHTRRKFYENFNKNLKVKCIDIIQLVKQSGTIELKTENGNFISLPDHTNYKFLIDIQGAGYSGRTKLLLHSNRPLFYQLRKCNEYWFYDLRPFEHYIPVNEDFSDFEDKLNWAHKNENKCKEISKNAFDYADKNLRKSNAVDRYKKVLIKAFSIKDNLISPSEYILKILK